jgi:GAF domain-containing protein
MNTDRLLRDLERRLASLPDDTRAEIIDAVREEVARDRRRLDPSVTVEVERERRLEAETLREVLEAINRQARLEDTMEEVLKQLSRIVAFDSCSVALAEPNGTFRILAVRGFPETAGLVGKTFRDPLTDAMRDRPQPRTIADVQQDESFLKMEGTEQIRAWAGLPLVVEGEIIGLLSLDRHRVDPFEDEDIHKAKAVAFSAAAAIRKAQLHEQLRRYATLMERTVEVDQAVFAGRAPDVIARQILEGALRIGNHRGGLLVVRRGRELVVDAASKDLEALVGRVAPNELETRATVRLGVRAVELMSQTFGIEPPANEMYLVPLGTAERLVGTIALFDADGESADDRLMEAYGARTSTAYLHALRLAELSAKS